MTDMVQIALIAGVPPTLAALGAFVLGILNHRQGNAIHVLVNSNLTEVKADLLLATQRIERLQNALVKKEDT